MLRTFTSIIFFSLLLLALENVEQCVCTPYEIRVVGVDVSVFDLYQLYDHVSGRSEALVQHLLHHIADPVLQTLEAVYLLEFNPAHNVSQFLVDLVCTVQGGLKQPCDLLPHKHFKGDLGYE